jgi:hypothetical protein
MKVYTAKIRHSENTIKAMAKTQYECFRSKSYYVMMVAAVALLGLALFVDELSQSIKTLMIMLGCFSIVGLGSPPRQLARQVISNLKGKFPAMEYTFGAKSVQLTGADTNVLEYKEILLLTFDSKYLYIFIQNRSAYMIERSSIKPDEKGLMQHLTEKTGLSWSRPGSMAKLSSLRFERVKTRL